MQLRTQFGDLYLEDALPAIEEIIMSKYGQYEQVGDMVFNRKSSGKAIEQTTGISQLGRFAQTDEGTQHSTDLFYQMYDKTYVHDKWTLGYALTRELVDDDQFGLVEKFSGCIGKSAFDTRETHAAEVLNDAFNGTSFVGGDGLALCSASHTLVSGTDSNLLATAADLDITSLQQATIEMADTVDERGKLLNIKPKMVLVPAALEYVAYTILNSTQLPGTANNDINAVQKRQLMPMVWNYLTDPDAWFLLADKGEHDLTWYDRDNLEMLSYEKPEVEGQVVYGRMRYSRGFNDWRGVFGTPGA